MIDVSDTTVIPPPSGVSSPPLILWSDLCRVVARISLISLVVPPTYCHLGRVLSVALTCIA